MPVIHQYPSEEYPDARPWLHLQLTGSPYDMAREAFEIHTDLIRQQLEGKITGEQFGCYVDDLLDDLLDEVREHYNYEYTRW